MTCELTVKDSGTDFTVYAGETAERFTADDLEFLSVADVLVFANTCIRRYSQKLSAAESRELAAEVLRKIHTTVATERGKVRDGYCIPSYKDSQAVRSRYVDAVVSMKRLVLAVCNAYVARIDGEVAPIKNRIRDTLRLRSFEDDEMFPSVIALGGVKLSKDDRHDIAQRLMQRVSEQAQKMAFSGFSGTEYQLFFTLQRLHFEKGRPADFSIDRSEFLAELGVRAKGGALQNHVEKISAILAEWSTKNPYYVIEPARRDIPLKFSTMVYLPHWQEIKAERGSAHKSVWRFMFQGSEHLFPDTSSDYVKIPTRPFALLTEDLGATLMADVAKHGAAVILTEISTGRKNPFDVRLETLRLTWDDFNRHTNAREKTIAALQMALGRHGVELNVEGEVMHVVP